jgi:hypothetical protein
MQVSLQPEPRGVRLVAGPIGYSDELEVLLGFTSTPDELWINEFTTKASELFKLDARLRAPQIKEDTVSFRSTSDELASYMMLLVKVMGEVDASYAPKAAHQGEIEEAARKIIREQLQSQ